MFQIHMYQGKKDRERGLKESVPLTVSSYYRSFFNYEITMWKWVAAERIWVQCSNWGRIRAKRRINPTNNWIKRRGGRLFLLTLIRFDFLSLHQRVNKVIFLLRLVYKARADLEASSVDSSHNHYSNMKVSSSQQTIRLQLGSGTGKN